MTSGDVSDRSLSVFYRSMESANTLMYALRSNFKTVRNAVGVNRNGHLERLGRAFAGGTREKAHGVLIVDDGEEQIARCLHVIGDRVDIRWHQLK